MTVNFISLFVKLHKNVKVLFFFVHLVHNIFICLNNDFYVLVLDDKYRNFSHIKLPFFQRKKYFVKSFSLSFKHFHLLSFFIIFIHEFSRIIKRTFSLSELCRHKRPTSGKTTKKCHTTIKIQ